MIAPSYSHPTMILKHSQHTPLIHWPRLRQNHQSLILLMWLSIGEGLFIAGPHCCQGFHSLPGTFAAWAVLRRAPGVGGVLDRCGDVQLHTGSKSKKARRVPAKAGKTTQDAMKTVTKIFQNLVHTKTTMEIFTSLFISQAATTVSGSSGGGGSRSRSNHTQA